MKNWFRKKQDASATNTNHSQRNKIIAIVAAVAVFVSGYWLISTRASGFFAAIEPESGTLTGNATIVSDTTASGDKAVQFNAPAQAGGGGSTGSCALPKYPTPDCTGYPAGTMFTAANTVNGDYQVRTNGTVIDTMHITGNVYILADNITIKNSQIDGTIYNDGTYYSDGPLHGHFTVTNTTIGPATGCIGQPGINDSNYIARSVRIRGHDDGFRVGPPGNVQVYDSYEENCYLPPSLAPPDGSHSDGVQAVCGGTPCPTVRIVHNTFEGRNVPTTNMLNLTDPSLSDVVATDNLMGGGAYIVDAWWHSGPKWTIQNNRFINNAWAYGSVSAENTCSDQVWSGNTLVTIDASYNITSTVGPQDCIQ